MGRSPEIRRVIRVFVSSPGDVTQERKVLDEVAAALNESEGTAHGVYIELFKWEDDVVPRIGRRPQQEVDAQTPQYDIYVGIMSARFGGGGTKKEFRNALKTWKDNARTWVAFYFDDSPRPSSKSKEVAEYLKVCEFREQLESWGIVGSYKGVRGSRDSFFEKISGHLRKIIHKIVSSDEPAGDDEPPPQCDPNRYLCDLCEKTAFIDIRGLQVGKGQAHRLAIEDLFISLTTCHVPEARKKSKPRARATTRRVDGSSPDPELVLSPRKLPLHDALQHDRLVIVGDPGAGKTTFLRRVAHTLCETELGDSPDAARSRLGLTDRTFPIYVRLNDLAQYLARRDQDPAAPAGDDSPAWFTHYLGAVAEANGCELDEPFFRQQMEAGRCTVLLDGLDEAPDRPVRQRLSRLLESLARTYSGCRLVVTSRPTAYTGEVILPDFAHARIEPLSDRDVETFLSRWCEGLYVESRATAQEHCGELLDALRDRPDIRRMARNPVMLTALAVVHWNERRLPEQRADLYDSIIRWLSRSREQRPGREKAERTVVLLQELALLMQDHPDGLKTEVPKRWAAEQLALEWTAAKTAKDAIAHAESFLDAEEIDSGIVVGRGSNVQFWHRTFQEFLAARAIAARPEGDQAAILWSTSPRLYLPEWREVILLLAGILHQQGPQKVDKLVQTMLERLGSQPSLADEARCAGLLGGMFRDLAPVDYAPPDGRYRELLDRVLTIFDVQGSARVAIPDRIAAADALGQVGDPRIDLRRADYWASIPEGKFLMGAQKEKRTEPNYDPEAYGDESPVHQVYLDAFRLAKYPLTVGQYRQFVEDDGYEDQGWWDAGGFREFSAPSEWESQLPYPSRPVVGVSWYEAAAYCAWAGYRLPTEAEWERAARGTDGRKYPWGDDPADPQRLNYVGSSINGATPVGIYPLGATPEGICDLAGNVLEWCTDSRREFSAKSVRYPRGSAEAGGRVIRGGSWGFRSRGCRAAFRYAYEPSSRIGNLGFRVAAVPLGSVPAASTQR